MADRKRTHWGWIVGTVLSLPVLYLLSFGPACWNAKRGRAPQYPHMRCAHTFYWPIGWLAHNTRPSSSYKIIAWYATLNDGPIAVPTMPGNIDRIDAIVVISEW